MSVVNLIVLHLKIPLLKLINNVEYNISRFQINIELKKEEYQLYIEQKNNSPPTVNLI